MGKLIKFGSGDVILKKALAKPEAFNVGEFTKAIAEDAGPMVKVTPLQTFAKLMKDEGWQKPVVHLGISGGNLVISGQSANGHKDSVIVHKGYAKLKAKKADVAVVNAEKGDSVIDSSTARMAKAKGVAAQDEKTAKLNAVKGDIIILAHGGSKGSKPGKIYANSFGGKTPKDIVRYLAKDKKLPLDYDSTVYLDGCFTAAGPSKGTSQKDLNNFAGTVYAGLKKLGYSKLQVKGNLGLAVTLDSGAEEVKDAQMEAEVKKRLKPFLKAVDALKKEDKKRVSKLMAAVNDQKKLQALQKKLETASDPTQEKSLSKVQAALVKSKEKTTKLNAAVQEVQGKLVEAQKARNAAKDKLMKKHRISDDAIVDLVGTFGPETL